MGPGEEKSYQGRKAHWDNIYISQPVQQLGWYEDTPTISLEMIDNCAIEPHEAILDIGAGATTLIDALLRRKYQHLIALDISEVGLRKLKTRLGTRQSARVKWLVDDITQPSEVLSLRDIAIWHDRAMLHFLLSAEEQAAYRATLHKVLKVGGFAIIAAFAQDGATKCSGLDVHRYDAESLGRFLGPEFERLESCNYTYEMPSGSLRPFIYTRFRKIR